MNELNTLRVLREDVAEPSPDHLAPALGKLDQAMRAPTRRRRAPRARLVLAGAAGATALTLIGGNAAMAAESAEAVSALHAIADETINFTDPAPGQYLLSRTHADWLIETAQADGTVDRRMNEQILEVYMPSDPNAEWVLYRDWNAQDAATGDDETLRAPDGDFYGGNPSIAADLADIPHTSGSETLAYFDAQYNGGNKSRDEDNFDRITSVLRSGLVPAQLRAALFEALALIPGVTSTADVANFDGKKGIAIGRTEVLRGGERKEIIVDPDTGLVIGERDLFTIAAFGFGVNEVIGHTAIETSVVDTAP